MENGTYEQIVAHLETEVELNGLEAPDEIRNFPRRSKDGLQRNYPRNQQDTVLHFECTVQVRRVSSKPTNTDILWNDPGTFRNTDVGNQEPSGDRSQNDPRPEVELSAGLFGNLTDSDPDETSHNIFPRWPILQRFAIDNFHIFVCV